MCVVIQLITFEQPFVPCDELSLVIAILFVDLGDFNCMCSAYNEVFDALWAGRRLPFFVFYHNHFTVWIP